MNTKKNKAKIRGKTTNTTEETVSTVEKIDGRDEVSKSDNLNKEENRVPEIITECDTVPENEKTISDVPKKPKRSKLKKKKDTLTEDIRDSGQDEITKKADDMQENIQNITEEVTQITPSIRKKKKKAKKHVINSKDFIESNITECVEQDSDKITITEKDNNEDKNQIEPQNTEITSKVESQSKKKKKKKHCQDPCTLDFQKLIEPDDSNKTENFEKLQIQLSSDNILANKNSSEVISIDENQMQEDCESFESKKMGDNKIDEKQLPEEETCMLKEVEASLSEKLILPETSNEDVGLFAESMTGESKIKESSPKPKAKIAKPVKKKSKIHVHKQSQIYEESGSKSIASHLTHNIIKDSTSDMDQNIKNKYLEGGEDKNVENELLKDNNFGKEVIFTSTGERPEMLNVENDFPYGIQNNQYDIEKQETKMPEISNDCILDRKNEKVTLEHTHDNELTLGFVDVETNEKDCAKQNENLLFVLDAIDELETKPMADIQEGSNINSFDLSCQKHEPKIFHGTCQTCTEKSDVKVEDTFQLSVPDRIEYPRSTSQQFIDTNNNNNDTLIQEIISPEVNFETPTSVVTPIIQGSGESPDVNYIRTPKDINVTEIVTQSQNTVKHPTESVTTSQCDRHLMHEKTDIKSKMIEVNQDMEELRLSIERSLAEFSFIEKSEGELDKKCETLLIQNLTPLPFNANNETIVNPEYKYNVSEVNCNIEESDKREGRENNKNLEDEVVVNLNENRNEINDNKKKLDETPSSSGTSKVFLVSDNNHQKPVIEDVTPICPARRDKGKNKSKKKNKKEAGVVPTPNDTNNTTSTSTAQSNAKDPVKKSKSEKSEHKPESTQNTKQQTLDHKNESATMQNLEISFEPIENFEDALSSSVDDVNKTFEIIVEDANQSNDLIQYHTNPQINIISPVEDMEQEGDTQQNNDKTKKQTPVSHPKNLLGHPNIPASSNKSDYKKEKNKSPNLLQAKVKIKDLVDFEKSSKEPKNNGKKLLRDSNELNFIYFTYVEDNLIYKYSFRKAFLQNMCHVCKKCLNQRVPCNFCALVFYCSQKHKDEDWSQHQSLCFAVSTLTHVKGLKHIYADTKDIIGNDYRILRMQVILSCEKILNRKLMPWEQEALLYPRLCGNDKCRQWKQEKLKDCEDCGQVSYCIDNPTHLPSSHQRWCKSFALYQKLISYQQTKGRLEPPLPTKVLRHYQIPDKMNDVLGSMYENKIDIDDVQYAALTQLATAPMTAAYCHLLFSSKMNSVCANGVGTKSTYTIHAIGVELPFEVDSLNKWELFFLHLRSDVQTLRVVMVGQDINSSKLPLDILKKIKLCKDCQTNKRRVIFDFRDNERYYNYYLSDDFVTPDIVCAFNANIQRSSMYNTEMWSSAINCILKQRVPFVITAYTIEELTRDLEKVKEWADIDFNLVFEIKYNPFCSVRPDRNFITDHEMPLLLKNYCFCITCGVL